MVQVNQVSHNRRSHPPPHLVYIMTFSKMGQRMCNPVEIPFQVSILPTAELFKETPNTMENMA